MTDVPGSRDGVLYVVALPIGNRDDVSARAIETLRSADIIAAEDTRHGSRLLAELGIEPRAMVSLHEHNESGRLPRLVAALREGRTVALVSDAGTPLVSDPGYRLVSAAHDAGVRVSPVPGACAAIAALSAAGLPSDRFFFEGFLPATASARQSRLQALSRQRGTLVFLEAPHRIVATLADCVGQLGAARQATLARELTKRYETVRRAPLEDLHAFVRDDADQQRGEIVLLVEGAADDDARDALPDAQVLLRVLAKEMPATRAARVASQLLGRPRRELYERLMALGADPDGDADG